MFKLVSKYEPSGEQPNAIKELFPEDHVEYFVSYYNIHKNLVLFGVV